LRYKDVIFLNIVVIWLKLIIFAYMYKARKYRIYPTNSQKELIHKHCGSVRFLYNLALETKTMAYLGSKVNLSRYDLQKQVVDLKKELPWLKETNSQSLQVALLDLDTAYSNFFKGRADFPKFKKKSNRGSFNVPQNVIVSDGILIIPKFKEGIKIKLHRDLVGTIKQATVSFTPTGKYFVSILCDTEKDIPSKPKVTEENSVGIDLGIKDFLVTSEGEVIDNPKFLRNSIDRLKVLQCRASKKQKGSSNRKKVNKRVAVLHEKITNQRQDFLHKTSTKIIRENQTICLENLGISNMMKNHNLAQAISDVSWGEFNRMIEYKAEWYGVNILRIGRFEPSSKTCECGSINNELTLSDRIWECKSCGRVNERDFLAARNIKKFALKDYSGVECTVEPVEMSTLVESMKQEAQPIASGVGG
jgi:putative transposase